MTIHLSPEKYRSFAFYRLPGMTEVMVIAERDGQASNGFYLAPFDNNRHSSHLIKADLLESLDQDRVSELMEVEGFKANSQSSGRFATREEHLELVKRAIESIGAGELKKVVCSRQTFYQATGSESIPKLFSKMCQLYPDAFVFCFSHPASGTWMGASPELLLEGAGNSFQTMSLAGTRHQTEERSWTLKESEEQSLVTDYITHTLSKLGVDQLEANGPRTVGAGQLLHLCTEISFKTNLPALSIARALHPTPAIAGLPVPQALAFIQEMEAYDRAYYSGYCGPVSEDGSASLFVNLRCLQLSRDKTILYAGGGILADSDPSSEWLETVRKTETVLGAIEKL